MTRTQLNKTTIVSLAPLAMLAATLLAGPTNAGEKEPAYTMTVFSDTGYGRKVTRGKYAEAIEKITAPSYRLRDKFESKHNLCVAYAKSGDLDNAAQSCDAAIALMRGKLSRMSRTTRKVFLEELSYDAYLAMALSNRGVLYALNGDRDRARSDFQEALELKAGTSAPKVNLARLDLAGTQGANIDD